MPLQRGPPSAQAGNQPSPLSPDRPPSSPTSAAALESSIAVPFQHLYIDGEKARPERREPFIYDHHQDRLPTWTNGVLDPREGDVPEEIMAENIVFHQRTVSEDKELESANGGPRPLPAQRPFLPHRNSSFSKRHASFDTPREVPLPYMSPRTQHLPFSSPTSHALSQANSIGQDGEPNPRAGALSLDGAVDSIYPVFEGTGDDGSSSTDSLSSVLSSSSSGQASSFGMTQSKQCVDMASRFPQGSDPYSSGSNSQTSPSSTSQWLGNMSASSSSSMPVWARPLSLPEPSRSGPPRIYSPIPRHANIMPDRSSTSSLPLPSHTPYHTLPNVSGSIEEDMEMADASAQASSSRGPFPPPNRTSSPGIFSSASPRYGRSMSNGSEMVSERAVSPPPSPRRLRDRTLSPVVSDNSSHRERERSIPPPQPPVVLTPPPPPLSDESNWHAPHEPFLAHTPAPQEAHIAVETSAREYRLVARLPGFRRDAITLSTRKRRILHVVADSWEPNGGHFERRISFGYDADLGQVRAEFDGELLRVIVPRRMIPLTYWGSRF